MSHPSRARIAELLVERADGVKIRGSGYLVGPSWVLSCAHVIAGARTVRVWLGAPAELIIAQGEAVDLNQVLLSPEADLALVPVAERPVGRVLFGRLARDAIDPLPATGAGFPRFKLRPAPGRPAVLLRELHMAFGRIVGLSDAKADTLELSDLNLVPADDPEPDRHSPWEGMSGAAVFDAASGRLIGVAAQHHPREGTGSLTVRPLTVLLDGPADAVAAWQEALPQLPAAGHQLDSVSPPTARALVVARAQRAAAPLAPPVLVARDEELADLAAFCSGSERWRWIQADAFAGKTALLATFVLHPPPDVDVAAYFLRRTTGDATADYALDVLCRQLAVHAEKRDYKLASLLRERVDDFLDLLVDAAGAAAQRGHRLLIVIDGLDEDETIQLGLTVAKWLPDEKSLPQNACLLISSREGVPVAIAADHPLRRFRTVLAPSEAAADIEALAEQELDTRSAGSGDVYDILGFLTAAHGGLAPRELAQFMRRHNRASISTAAIADILDGRLARTIRRTDDVDGLELELRVFAHDVLRAKSVAKFADDMARYRETIDAEAAIYREQGWPVDTLRYFVAAYPTQLAVEAQEIPPTSGRYISIVESLTGLIESPRRGAMLLEKLGHPIAYDKEIATVQHVLQRTVDISGTDEDHQWMVRLARLALRRQPITGNLAEIADRIAPIWATTGRIRAAYTFANAVTSSVSRQYALRAVGIAAAADANSVDLALEIAEQLTDSSHAVDVLSAAAATMIRMGDRDGAASALDTIDNSVEKVDALIKTADVLTKAKSAEDAARIVDIATEHIQEIRSDAARAQALALIARSHHLSPSATRATASQALVLARSVTDRKARNSLVNNLLNSATSGYAAPQEILDWAVEAAPMAGPLELAVILGMVVAGWASSSGIHLSEEKLQQLSALAWNAIATRSDHSTVHDAIARFMKYAFDGDEEQQAHLAILIEVNELDRELGQAIHAAQADATPEATEFLEETLTRIVRSVTEIADPTLRQGAVAGIILVPLRQGFADTLIRMIPVFTPEAQAVAIPLSCIQLAEDGEFSRAIELSELSQGPEALAWTRTEIAVRLVRAGAAADALDLVSGLVPTSNRAAALVTVITELPDSFPADDLLHYCSVAAGCISSIDDGQAAASLLAVVVAHLAKVGLFDAAAALASRHAPDGYLEWTHSSAVMDLCSSDHSAMVPDYAQAADPAMRPIVFAAAAQQLKSDHDIRRADQFVRRAVAAAVALEPSEQLEIALATMSNMWSHLVLGGDLLNTGIEPLLEQPDEAVSAFLSGIEDVNKLDECLDHLIDLLVPLGRIDDAVEVARYSVQVMNTEEYSSYRTHRTGGIAALAAAGHFPTAMAVLAKVTSIEARIARYLDIARAAATDERHDNLREVATEIFALLGRLPSARDREWQARDVLRVLIEAHETDYAISLARAADETGQLLAGIAGQLLERGMAAESANVVAAAVRAASEARKPQDEGQLVLDVATTLAESGHAAEATALVEDAAASAFWNADVTDQMVLFSWAAALMTGHGRQADGRRLAAAGLAALDDRHEDSPWLIARSCVRSAVVLKSADLTDTAEALAGRAADAAARERNYDLEQLWLAGLVEELTEAGLLSGALTMAKNIANVKYRCEAYGMVGRALARSGAVDQVAELIAEMGELAGDTSPDNAVNGRPGRIMALAGLKADAGAVEDAIDLVRSLDSADERGRGLWSVLTSSFFDSDAPRAMAPEIATDIKQLIPEIINDEDEILFRIIDRLRSIGNTEIALEVAIAAAEEAERFTPVTRLKANFCLGTMLSAAGAEPEAEVVLDRTVSELDAAISAYAMTSSEDVARQTGLLTLAGRLRKLGRAETADTLARKIIETTRPTGASMRSLLKAGFYYLAVRSDLAGLEAERSADFLAEIIEEAKEVGDTLVINRALARLLLVPECRPHLYLLPGPVLKQLVDEGSMTFGPR